MRAEKKQMVQELVSLLKDRSAVLISYQGLTANVFNGFRAKVADSQAGASCHVVPNTLLKKAAAELGLKELAECDLSGDTALVSGSDPVSLVKTVKEFATIKENSERVKVKMSVVESQLLDAKDTMALADMPSKEAIQGQLLGLFQAPASGIVRALNAKVASILYVLNAHIAKQESQTA